MQAVQQFTVDASVADESEFDVAVQVANAVSQTGIYAWSALVQLTFNGGLQASGVVSGESGVVVENGSAGPTPLGAGWGIDGISQIVRGCGTTDVMMVYGDGAFRVFQFGETKKNGDSTYTNPEDFGTLVELPDWDFEYTATDGTVSDFNSSGLLTSVTDADGQELSYTYDSNGRLSSVTAPDGWVTNFTWGGTVTIAEAGRTVTLAGGSNLTSITVTPTGGTATVNRSFGYSGGLLTTDTWAPMQATIVYNPAGLVSSVNLGSGSLYTIVPAAALPMAATVVSSDLIGMATVTDSLSDTTTYTVDMRGRELSEQQTLDDSVSWEPPQVVTQQWQLDAAGDVVQYTDELGQITTYLYDGDGNVAVITYPDGSGQSYVYNSFAEVTHATDQNDKVTSYQYDDDGNLTKVTDPLGNKTTYAYYPDSDGLLETMTDPLGNVTTYQYDTNTRRLTDMIAANTGITYYTYSASGNPYQTKNPLGEMTTDTYDQFNRETEEVDALGNYTAWSYYPDGQLQTEDEYSATLNEIQTVASDQYDTRGLRTSQTIGGSGLNGVTTTDQYDAAQNLIAETVGYSVTTYEYDSLDREVLMSQGVSNVTGPNGPVQVALAETEYEYNADGSLESTTDPDGNVTRYFYDALGRVTEVQEAYIAPGLSSDGTVLTPASVGRSTYYRYDADGNVICEIQGVSQVNPQPTTTQYVYDDDNRLIQTYQAVNSPEETETTDTYDKNGNLLAETTGIAESPWALPGFNQPVTTAYTYNNMNEVVSETDASGTAVAQPTTYGYDLAGDQVTATDPLGRVTYSTYDAGGELTGVYTNYKTVSVGGMVVPTFDTGTVYTYDGFSDRASQTTGLSTNYQANPDTTTYLYDAAGRLTDETDGANSARPHTGHIDYDTMGNVSYTTMGPAPVYYTYDLMGRVTGEYDNYNTFSQRYSRGTTYQYDGDGNVVLEITGLATDDTHPDPSTTKYQYDGLGRVTAEMQGYSEPDYFLRLTTFTYNAMDQQVSVTTGESNAPPVAVTAQAPDAAYRYQAHPSTTTYTYDGLGQLRSETDAVGTAQVRTTGYYYDSQGNLYLTIDPLDIATWNSYDALGQLLASTQDFNIPGLTADGPTATTVYQYDAVGRLAVVTDPRGYQTIYTYNSLDLPAGIYEGASADPDDPSSFDYERGTTYVYDADGNVISSTTGYSTTLTPRPITTNYTYDVFDHQTSMTAGIDADDPDDDADVQTSTTKYNYFGWLLSSTDAQGQTTSYGYDAFGDLTRATPPAGAPTTYTYDAAGNQTYSSVTMTTYRYDALNEMTAAIQAGPQALDVAGNFVQLTATVTTFYAYDAAGNQVRITQPAGNVQQFQYDALNRLVAQVNAQNQTTTTTYNADNEVTSTTDADGNVTRFGYDDLGRQTSVISASGSTSALTTYQYDLNGNLTYSKSPDGRSIVYSYDALNQKTGETWYDTNGTTVNNTLTYTYDPLGDMLTATDNAGTVTMIYDNLGREIQENEAVKDQNGQTVSLFTTYTVTSATNSVQTSDTLGGVTVANYNLAGQLAAKSLSLRGAYGQVVYTYNSQNLVASLSRYSDSSQADLVTNYTYDTAGRLLTDTTTNSSGASVFSAKHGYNQLGQVAVDLENGTQRYSYRYTPTGQVASSGTFSYFYDANGNILSGTTNASGTINVNQYGRGNVLVSDSLWTYSYDANGNRIGQKAKNTQVSFTYSYDQHGQMTSAMQWQGQSWYSETTYQYDALGRLISETVITNPRFLVGGFAQQYVYEGNALRAVLSGGKLQSEFVTSPNGGAPPVQINAGSAWPIFFVMDRQGSVRMSLTWGADGAAQTASYNYSPTGQLTQNTGGSPPLFGYQGMFVEPFTGMVRSGDRLLDTATAHWLNQNPMGNGGASNDPQRFFDDNSSAAMAAAQAGPAPPMTYLDAAGVTLTLAAEATVNAAGHTVQSLFTLGLRDGGNIWSVTNQDMANGYGNLYAAARVITEGLTLLAGAGLVKAPGMAGMIGRALMWADTARGATGAIEGTADAVSNGLSWQNGLQIGGGLLGFRLNVGMLNQAGAGGALGRRIIAGEQALAQSWVARQAGAGLGWAAGQLSAGISQAGSAGYNYLSSIGRRLSLVGQELPQLAGSTAIHSKRSVASWFAFWADQGGETVFHPASNPTFFSKYAPIIHNFETPGTISHFDTAVHEGVHSFIGRKLSFITDIGEARISGIPIGAPVAYAEELVAYSAGHIAAGRLHALPFVPLEALNSLTPGQRAVTLAAAGTGFVAYQANKN